MWEVMRISHGLVKFVFFTLSLSYHSPTNTTFIFLSFFKRKKSAIHQQSLNALHSEESNIQEQGISIMS